MSNFDTVVLDGEMGLFTKVREGDLPYYTGETEVTPSDTSQVLETADTIVTENITINPIPDMDLEEVQVTYTPDEEGQTDTITPSTGYVGIAEVEVTVEPIDPDYVGSGIARHDSDDLTASGATVIAPAGYYEEAAMKSVASGSATTPDTSITANPTISVGNDGSITASVSATQSVTPTVSAGYVSSGTAGTITVSGSGSSQLSTQAAATITPTTSQQTAVAAGKFTTGAVVVDKIPSQYIVPTGTKSISANGTGIDVTEYAAVDVAVPGDTPTLQTKSVSYTPTESAQSATVTADQGYDGLDEVNVSVGAISSSYVGSAIDRRDSTDLSASGATVTAPAGYYAAAASKSVASGSAATPATTITANPSISVDSSGLITATASASQSVTPTVSAGYVSSGTSGTVTVSGSATSQLTTQAAQTIHPSTSDQTIASGKYLTGAQTIKAVTTTNLTAANIVSGVTVEIGDADDSDCVASVTGTASGGDTSWVTGEFYGDLVFTETTLGQAFKSSTGDFTITMPNVTTFKGSQQFQGSTGAKKVYFPNYTGQMPSEMCYNNTVTEVVFAPKATSGNSMNGKGVRTYVYNIVSGTNTLSSSNALKTVDCNQMLGMNRTFYSGCPNVDTLILRSTSLSTMSWTNAFDSTPFANGGSGGTIYIPKSLYDHLGDGTSSDYKAATNWSTIDGYGTITWAKIEGSQYENYYADGTPIPTT